jgi:hypothetical protein
MFEDATGKQAQPLQVMMVTTGLDEVHYLNLLRTRR